MQLYDAHPAFLLRRRDDDDPCAYPTERLGMDWLGLPSDERTRRTNAFRAALLAYIADDDGDRFTARFADPVDAERVAAAADATRDGRNIEGTMSASAAEALASAYFVELRVKRRSGEVSLLVLEGWQAAGVWTESDPARLRAVLERAVASSAMSSPSRRLVAVGRWILAQAVWLAAVAVGILALIALPSIGIPRAVAIAVAFIMVAALVLAYGAWEQRAALRRERTTAAAGRQA